MSSSASELTLTGGPNSGKSSELAFRESGSKSPTLAHFLELLFARSSAELVDLGPAVGANITFLAERICCKIHVEDIYADLEHHARHDTLDRFPEFLQRRVSLPDESVDAVLCWDIFDFLAPAAASVLAHALKRVLRRGGALLGFFSGGGPDEQYYIRYVIEEEARLRRRFYAASCGRRVLQNRDINELFSGLELLASVLLKSGVREVLFRKPSHA